MLSKQSILMNKIHDLKVVSIILARKGSKGLKNKNIVNLAGRPLIFYTIEASKLSKYISRTIVSTDSNKIKSVAKSCGAEVPFIRPKEYSKDQSTSEEALYHCINWLKKNENFRPDIVVYLQITDPFRQVEMIDKCVEKLISNPKLDSVFMGLKKHKNYWRKVNNKYVRIADDIDSGAPRQSKEPLYREDTGIALATRTHVIEEGKRIGKNIEIIPYSQEIDFIDIHSKFDLWLSKKIIEDKKITPNKF
jgi:CMP-N,N'-diacetyllegionaminic acid synthase